MPVSYILNPTTSFANPGSITQVECIGAGGAGQWGNHTSGQGTPGSGGGYASWGNPTGLSATITVAVGAGGTCTITTGTGSAGGQTAFNGSTVAAASVGANGGGAGLTTTTGTVAGGTGGGTGTPLTTHSGGASGNTPAYGAAGIAGAGGAGGPNNVGGAGGAGVQASTTGSAGGGGNGGGGTGTSSVSGTAAGQRGGTGQNGTLGGTGGASGVAGNPGSNGSGGGGSGVSPGTTNTLGGQGGAGVDWDATHGSGGGGGGCSAGTTSRAGAQSGGNYGGGGTGCGNGAAAPTATYTCGANGIIRVSLFLAYQTFSAPQIAEYYPNPIYPYVYTQGAQPYGRGTYVTPSGAVVVVTQVPFSNAWMGTVVQSWFQQDPQPTLPKYLPQPFVPPVTSPYNPYTMSWLSTVLQSWQAPDPQPTLVGKLSPGIPGQSVDNPPTFRQFQPPYPVDVYNPQPLKYLPQPAAVVVTTQGPYNNLWLSTVLQSWVPLDQPPTLPRQLPASLIVVPNPPFSQVGRTAWLNNVIAMAWQPVDPLPTLRVSLPQPFVPAVVNNPPFSSVTRSELSNILAQWAAWPPQPLPTPSSSPSQVQPGFTPPPPVTPPALFTVSGPDVSTYLVEFHYGVSYTDAPVAKRTV